MDLLIFSGQSNMQGQTESLPPCHVVKRAFEYRFQTDSRIPLQHPVGEDFGDLLLGAHEGHGSLVPDFCEAYVKNTGREVLAVHAAKGATTIAQWLSPSERYQMLVKKCRAAISSVNDVGKIFFIWLQGESDAIEGTSSAVYCRRLKTFRADLVRDLHIDGFFLIRVGKFTRDERDLEILCAQEELCQTDEFVMLTRCTGWMTEHVEQYMNPFAEGHYNNAAMSVIGRRAGEQLACYARGIPLSLEEEPYEEMKQSGKR